MEKFSSLLGDNHKFNIECKGRGRNFELSYEGSISKDTNNLLEMLNETKNTVAETLSEFLSNLTDKNVDFEEEDQILKSHMSDGWNIDLFIDSKYIYAMAKKVDDSEEVRYGKKEDFGNLIDFLFHNYSVDDEYVLAQKEQKKKWENELNKE